MAFTEEGGNMVMPVSPMGNGGFGDGFGGGGWWILLLFILLGGNGWGGGFGGGDNMIYPWLNNSQNINGGFRDQMLNTQISGIQNAVTSGFGDVQTALCGGFAGVNATVNGAQNSIAQQMYTNQMADMQQNFANQTATLQGFNGLQSQLAQCCCDNRLATCQTQNLVSTEAAANRLAIQNQTQQILDKMCEQTITALQQENAQLRESETRKDIENYVQNALTAQTQYILGLYPPTAARTATTAG